MNEQQTIVVGVDGSAASRTALRWALGQAAATGARVRAVVAWEFPAFYSWEGGPLPPEGFEETARSNLDTAVAAECGAESSPVPVSKEVRHGHSASALLEAAENASLLVVGSRGHGSFYGALLGSVSQRCAIHARCPVVIVRECAQS